jgi:hypothetical protein
MLLPIAMLLMLPDRHQDLIAAAVARSHMHARSCVLGVVTSPLQEMAADAAWQVPWPCLLLICMDEGDLYDGAPLQLACIYSLGSA